jgi:hypothetical protein
MSDPNCLRRVSECIFFDALSRPLAALPLPLPLLAALLPELLPSAPPEAGPGEVGDRPADALLSVRLSTGERGISCSWGSVRQCQSCHIYWWVYRGTSGVFETVGRWANDGGW